MAPAAMVAHLLAVLLLFRFTAAVSVSIPVATRYHDDNDCRYSGPITGSVPLVAGQTIDAGSVSYTVTDTGSGSFSAEITVNVGGSCTAGSTAHVDLVSHPKTTNRQLAPGKWPCRASPSSDMFSLTCAASGLSCCGTKYLYVHVEVHCGGKDETAFAGNTLCTTRRWCRYIELEPPCGDCDCDTGNDRCYIKTNCPAFPESCTFEPLCENRVPTDCVTPTQCTGDQTRCLAAVCPGATEPGVPTTCITPEACDGDLGDTHCNLDTVCDKEADCIPTTTCECGEKVCTNLAGMPHLPTELLTACKVKEECPGTVGVDHCTIGPVCDISTDCPAPTSCPDNKCGGPVCANLAGQTHLPDTVQTVCADKITCAEEGKVFCNSGPVCATSECVEATDCHGEVGVDHCTIGPVCDLSKDCPAPTSCPDNKCGGPVCANLAGQPHLPDTVQTVCEDKITCAEEGKVFCNSGPVCAASECVEAEACDVEEQCNGEFKCAAPNALATVPETCVGRQDCGLTGCSIQACPGSCPTECPGNCPPCFVENTTGTGPECLPDPDENDSTCNPCENGGNAICDEVTGLNKFKCCPDTSDCKKTTIPNRLSTTQDQLEVSFVCSANCGNCDTVTSKGVSNACVLFKELPLGSDGDDSTDDVLNVCDDLTVQNS